MSKEQFLHPTGSYVILRRVEPVSRSAGGIALINLKPDEAEVVAVGPDCTAPRIEPGARVKVVFEHGVDIKDDAGQEFHVADPENILCVMPAR